MTASPMYTFRPRVTLWSRTPVVASSTFAIDRGELWAGDNVCASTKTLRVGVSASTMNGFAPIWTVRSTGELAPAIAALGDPAERARGPRSRWATGETRITAKPPAPAAVRLRRRTVERASHTMMSPLHDD